MKFLWSVAKRLHSDERGAEGLEKLLIIAVIVLPLLGLLIWFRQAIGRLASDWWSRISGEAQQDVPTP